jgi:hypothetical protein
VNVLGGSYTKDDIQSYDPKTGITTFKNGLQVNPKLRQFSIPANGVRYTYSAAALNKNGQPGIVGTAPDESQLYQKADAEAMKKGADKGIFPQQFGIGTPDETPESKKLYHAALARALGGTNPQQYQEQKTSEALSYITDFIEPHLNSKTTGVGGKIGRNIPLLPNEAKYFDGLLKSLKNRIGLNELQEMRNASKSGGALGQISDKENEILQNSLAALDPSLSADQLSEQLDVVKRHLQAWQKAKQEHGTAAGVPPPTGDIPLITSQAEYDALPAGAWYRDSQGKKRKPQAQNPYNPAQQSLVNP